MFLQRYNKPCPSVVVVAAQSKRAGNAPQRVPIDRALSCTEFDYEDVEEKLWNSFAVVNNDSLRCLSLNDAQEPIDFVPGICAFRRPVTEDTVNKVTLAGA